MTKVVKCNPQALYPDNNSANSTGRQRLPTATANRSRRIVVLIDYIAVEATDKY